MKTVAFASLLAAMLANAANASLAFYAMGDVPYDHDQKDNLEDQIDDLDGNDAHFTVHLGDFNSPDDTGCTRSHFEEVANILADGPVATFVLAGDNDYLDCPDSSAAWRRYKDTFVGFEDEWEDHDIDVNRKSGGSSSSPGGQELFAFNEDGILFVSTVLMRGSGWSERASASKNWIEEQLGEYKDDDDFRGVVIFSHAENDDDDDLEDFFEDIEDMFSDEGVDVPVLYLCGDKHRYVRDKGFNGWDQLDYVSVDKGGCADPILVEVADEGASFGSGSNVFGDGLFKIDRRGGRYGSSECR